MYDMPKRTERVLHFLTFLVQGSSYLDSRAYAILHREHHAFSDTERDPHSPWQHTNALSMMWRTKKRYSDFAHRRREPEPRFDGGVSEWPWVRRIAHSLAGRIGLRAVDSLFFFSLATALCGIALPSSS